MLPTTRLAYRRVSSGHQNRRFRCDLDQPRIAGLYNLTERGAVDRLAVRIPAGIVEQIEICVIRFLNRLSRGGAVDYVNTLTPQTLLNIRSGISRYCNITQYLPRDFQLSSLGFRAALSGQ